MPIERVLALTDAPRAGGGVDGAAVLTGAAHTVGLRLGGRAHHLAQILGVIDQLSPHDLTTGDFEHLGGGEDLAGQHGHLPVDDRAHDIAVHELAAHAEDVTAAPASAAIWVKPAASVKLATGPL
jgi:hypothetical protein